MHFRLLNVLLFACLAVLSQQAITAQDPVIIRYDDAQKLKTSLQWLGLRPGAIRPSVLAVTPVVRNKKPSPRAGDLQAGRVTTFPAAAIGKLIFVRPSGEAGSCTATFVASNNVLLTAANCIAADATGVNKDFIYVSGYGTDTQQIYDVECIAFPREWRTEKGAAAWRHNYAFVRTGRNSTFGGLGITNALTPRRLSQIGFAENIGEGIEMQGVDSDTYMTRDGLVGAVYTGLGAGSSGNPWVRNYIVYSLSSHYDPAQPEILLGPRFTSDTMDLLARVRSGC